MDTIKTQRLCAEDLALAAHLLKSGKLVALPTETVYGLAADAGQAAAVEVIYRAKGRPEQKPLSVLVDGMPMVESLCCEIPEAAYRLAAAFWPGALTLVLKTAGVLPPIVTAGGDSLGVRVPDHPLTLALIEKLDRPLAAPSANRSGEGSPKSAADVLVGLDGHIDAVLDGGLCTLSIESTIVDLTGMQPRILRQGALAAEQIFACLEGRL